MPSLGQAEATYKAAGNERGIRRLVDTFYEIMSTHPDFATIWSWPTETVETAADKLKTHAVRGDRPRPNKRTARAAEARDPVNGRDNLRRLYHLPALNTRNADIDSFANLARYGLTESVQGRFAQIRANDPDLVPGRVARVDGISTFVHASSSDYRAASKLARFAHENELGIEPAQPTVGDWVLVRPGPNRDSGTIELVLPRSSLLVRKRATRGAKIGTDQILAANIDTAFVVQSTTYFNTGRLERELALVWASGSTPVVVLTKSDLLEDGGDKLAEVLALAAATAPGVEVFAVSGMTGEGTDALRRFSATGMTVVLIGASGVGKSTLVNQLLGEEVMDTGEIRESDARGRHTTTTRQLLPLPGGGVLIDSPGIRTIGLAARSEEALSKTFSEIEPFLGACSFDDCSHEGEPECAVADAIADGRLQASRFESYSQMKRELQQDQARSDLRPKGRTGRRDDQD